jgi:hypothetical protein
MNHQITIIFPTPEHKQTFAEWMSDGGGEWNYMESIAQEGHAKVVIGYHGTENKQYPITDKRRYGPFMVDDTIRVELADDEES